MVVDGAYRQREGTSMTRVSFDAPLCASRWLGLAVLSSGCLGVVFFGLRVLGWHFGISLGLVHYSIGVLAMPQFGQLGRGRLSRAHRCAGP